MVYESASQCIGKTPLVRLHNVEKVLGLKAKIFAKVEYFNPAGSVKDRIGLAMIEDAEAKGKLREGSIIVEPTSGNTGIGIASVAATKGYKIILTMPESMSIERRKLLKAYGAELVLTPASEGMKGAVDEAKRICEKDPNAIILGQFENPANPLAHYKTTGPEIYEDLGDEIDFFVAGIGTGGTITGTGRFLKEKKESVKLIGIEPETSPLLSKGVAGPHKIQGIGANFIPDTLDQGLLDEIIACPNEKAFEFARLVGKKEGMLIGISSGAALFGAIEIAKREENEGKSIVVLFPDTGDRYLSTALFED